MRRKSGCRRYQGRLRAVLSCALALWLSGCANSGTSPLGASLQALLPDEASAGEQAAAVPYASLSARMGDVEGLMVMGAQAGDMSYWPSRSGGVLELHDGGLHATAGLPRDLLGTRYSESFPWRQDAPSTFRLVRHWQEGETQVARGEARGQMQCDPPTPVALPLGDRSLERCTARLAWTNGDVTTSVYWRDPLSRRLWAVRETPWPGAPTLEWQVARHWW